MKIMIDSADFGVFSGPHVADSFGALADRFDELFRCRARELYRLNVRDPWDIDKKSYVMGCIVAIRWDFISHLKEVQ